VTVEERLWAADRLTAVLERVVGTAAHPSGLCTVSATALGALVAVRLEPAVLGHGPEAVGRMVVETAALAVAAAVQTSYNEVAKALGDGMAMAIEAFAGPPPFATGPAAPASNHPPATPPRAGQVGGATRPRPAQPPAQPPVEDDDDDFFADPFRGQRR
jgi:hypothetical protein